MSQSVFEYLSPAVSLRVSDFESLNISVCLFNVPVYLWVSQSMFECLSLSLSVSVFLWVSQSVFECPSLSLSVLVCL